ncbi:MAG: DMT family transporter [Anaerolineae bacterium]|nr:DMT family transporter [Anaerolineae bacterium]
MPIGETAALLAALSISLTSVCYTLAGRKINAITSIALSLPIAWVLLIGLHRLLLGAWIPPGLSLERAFYLGASGVLAFIISSYCMLIAFQHIGPRLASVILSFTPVLVAILAWALLGESLPTDSAIGIVIVILGIIMVVAEPRSGKAAAHRGDFRRGVLLACLGTLMQSVAFLFASQGVKGGFAPISATLVRITAATLTLWLFLAARKRIGALVQIVRGDLALMRLLTGAAVSGPVIGGLLLLFSFQFVPVGVSTTLSHTSSIMLIPISYLVFRERITARAVVGSVVSIVGIALLFL